MPDNKGTLLPASYPADNALSEKPTPPDDLWDKLDQLVGTIHSNKVPERAFTTAQFAAHRGISKRLARDRIVTLVEAGKLLRFGCRGYYYYMLPEDAKGS